jgi:hypothetical protein
LGEAEDSTPYPTYEHGFEETAMAYITIKINTDEGPFTLQERVAPSDMESEVYCAHLVERLRWAVEDAHGTASNPR